MSPRVFTVEEIDALIPELSHRVGLQLSLGAELETLADALTRETRTSGTPKDLMSPRPGDSAEARSLREKIRSSMARYEQGWREVQDIGAVVKDARAGLLDFYGRLEGRLVWLCWRFGEDRIAYYHELDAGFSGRRSLGAEIRQRVLN